MVSTRPKTISAYLDDFFKRYPLLRNLLIALSASLLIVAAIAATIATLGAAAPALGVSWGAVMAFFGSPLIIGMAGSVGVACLTAIGFGLMHAFANLLKSRQSVVSTSPPHILAAIPATSLTYEQPMQTAVPLAGLAAVKSDVDRSGATNKAFKQVHEKKFLQAQLEQAAYRIITKPDEKRVEEILATNPELLLKKIKEIKDPSGRRIINATLLQLAFGSGNSAMCNLLQKFFEKMYGSDSKRAYCEMQQQLAEKFDNEIKMVNQDTILQQLSILMENIIQAITDDPMADLKRDENEKIIIRNETLQAINTFKTSLATLLPQVIDKGIHFCPEMLLLLREQYTKAKCQWQGQKDLATKCALFEDVVVVEILHYVPAHDARCFARGVGNFDESESPWLPNSRKTKNNEDFYRQLYSPSPDFPIEGTGFDIISGCSRRKGCLSHMVRRKSVSDPANNISIDDYIRIRFEGLESFKQRIQEKLENTSVLANVTR